jgi:hypothetical protein
VGGREGGREETGTIFDGKEDLGLYKSLLWPRFKCRERVWNARGRRRRPATPGQLSGEPCCPRGLLGLPCTLAAARGGKVAGNAFRVCRAARCSGCAAVPNDDPLGLLHAFTWDGPVKPARLLFCDQSRPS